MGIPISASAQQTGCIDLVTGQHVATASRKSAPDDCLYSWASSCFVNHGGSVSKISEKPAYQAAIGFCRLAAPVRAACLRLDTILGASLQIRRDARTSLPRRRGSRNMPCIRLLRAVPHPAPAGPAPVHRVYPQRAMTQTSWEPARRRIPPARPPSGRSRSPANRWSTP